MLNNVEIEIKLLGGIAYYSPEGRGRYCLKKQVEKETSVRQLVEGLQLPKELHFIIMVNGEVIDRVECVLKNGDKVALVMPFSGG